MSTFYSSEGIMSRLTNPVSDLTKRELERRWVEHHKKEILEKAMRAFDSGSSKPADNAARDSQHTEAKSMHAFG